MRRVEDIPTETEKLELRMVLMMATRWNFRNGWSGGRQVLTVTVQRC